MQKLSLSLLLLGMCCARALGQDKAAEPDTNAPPPIRIPASEAKKHINTNAIVTGKVAELNKAERLVRLNLDKPYPDQSMTAVIFAAKTNLFPDIDKFEGQTVEVSGKITLYRDHPEIIINSTNQLKIAEKAAAAPKK